MATNAATTGPAYLKPSEYIDEVQLAIVYASSLLRTMRCGTRELAEFVPQHAKEALADVDVLSYLTSEMLEKAASQATLSQRALGMNA